MRRLLFTVMIFSVLVMSAAVFAQQTKKASMSDRDYIDPVTGMQFAFVKGGCYDMGDISGYGRSEEKPLHEVCVDDFYIGKFTVTQEEWQKLIGDNPSHFVCTNCPVVDVSWEDTQKFIGMLNQRSGKNYRLPTEAEWEYAARSGGKKEIWAGTSNASELEKYAWYDANSFDKQPHSVGERKPNGLGLYDMTGNVWQWVADRYDGNHYSKSPRNNPQGPESGSSRVTRGGSFRHVPMLIRASYRGGARQDYRSHDKSFRLAWTP